MAARLSLVIGVKINHRESHSCVKSVDQDLLFDNIAVREMILTHCDKQGKENFHTHLVNVFVS